MSRGARHSRRGEEEAGDAAGVGLVDARSLEVGGARLYGDLARQAADGVEEAVVQRPAWVGAH